MNIRELLREYDGFGKTYYSPFLGDVILDVELTEEGDSFIFKELNDYLAECPNKTLYDDGCFCPNGELIVFPSKEQRDWNVWAEEQKKIRESSQVIKEGDYVELTYRNSQSWGKVTEVDNTGRLSFVVDQCCQGEKFLVDIGADKVKKIDRFTPTLLKTFDKVLVTDNKETWFISHFGIMTNGGIFECSNGTEWKYVIPYNKETDMLLHDKDAKLPDFYNYNIKL